ncbi:CBS domain-containing protein [Alkalihalobacterium bogoriense]|uniref:CBS domain-containing protein n=1 Tax=Alkalihalobacterium bogoriense TaxID=246272 RepID=UPI0006868442|nr:CBS domain-containing protein [Alkalihalobacterium bogoriense]
MEIIVSHTNTDFDALASLVAAKKLYPDAKMVISHSQHVQVQQYLALYRDHFSFYSAKEINWKEVTHLILVDVHSIERTGLKHEQLHPLHITIFDHHPALEQTITATQDSTIEQVGATITLLVERLMVKEIPLTPIEATLFGLGLYTDTGAFTHPTTTTRDFIIASALLQYGMNLEFITRMTKQIKNQNHELFYNLLQKSTEYLHDGIALTICTHSEQTYTSGLATITKKLLVTTEVDAVITIVEMGSRTFVVGRANSKRINFLPLIKKLGGGGHPMAASASIKNGSVEELNEQIVSEIKSMITPAVIAKHMMSAPVKTIAPETSLQDVAEMMFRYGHTGFPVVENEKVIGMISRRDIDKGIHHGLGHAPAKAYMSQPVLTVETITPLEEIQRLMIQHNVGRFPVMNNNTLVGIISRTNVIETLNNPKKQHGLTEKDDTITTKMKAFFSTTEYKLLKKIGELADEKNLRAFLVGGIVRDLFLQRPNDDIDIVIEGDGIQFANELAQKFGGSCIDHEPFATASWKTEDGIKVDIVSSRTEYYVKPAALPTVEKSNVKEDLFRRDFSINAMAIHLNSSTFGFLVDEYNGLLDINEKKIRVLHPLSFVEDPTRILRAVRFELRFQFQMDEQTEKFAFQSINGLKNISSKRLIAEVKRLFQEAQVGAIMQRLNSLLFWETFIGRSLKKQDFDTIEKLTSSIRKAKLDYKPTQHWFYYFLLPFMEANENEVLKLWETEAKAERKQVIECTQLVSKWKGILFTSLGQYHKHLHKYDDFPLILFSLYLTQKEQQERLLEYVWKRKTIPPLITGSDLASLITPAGPIYKTIILDIETRYLNNQIQTREQAVAWLKEQWESE